MAELTASARQHLHHLRVSTLLGDNKPCKQECFLRCSGQSPYSICIPHLIPVHSLRESKPQVVVLAVLLIQSNMTEGV